MARNAGLRGSYRWRLVDDTLNPGLFSGLAGLGYMYLRLGRPKDVPMLLLWEAEQR